MIQSSICMAIYGHIAASNIFFKRKKGPLSHFLSTPPLTGRSIPFGRLFPTTASASCAAGVPRGDWDSARQRSRRPHRARRGKRQARRRPARWSSCCWIAARAWRGQPAVRHPLVQPVPLTALPPMATNLGVLCRAPRPSPASTAAAPSQSLSPSSASVHIPHSTQRGRLAAAPPLPRKAQIHSSPLFFFCKFVNSALVGFL